MPAVCLNRNYLPTYYQSYWTASVFVLYLPEIMALLTFVLAEQLAWCGQSNIVSCQFCWRNKKGKFEGKSMLVYVIPWRVTGNYWGKTSAIKVWLYWPGQFRNYLSSIVLEDEYFTKNVLSNFFNTVCFKLVPIHCTSVSTVHRGRKSGWSGCATEPSMEEVKSPICIYLRVKMGRIS